MLASFNDPCLEEIETILLEGTKMQHCLQTQKAWNPTTKMASVFMVANPPAIEETKKPDTKVKTHPKKPDANKEAMKKECPTHDRLGNPINRHPPKTGESNQKENALMKRLNIGVVT